MRDVSAGGALLETESLDPGERIRIEVDGAYARFSIAAIVVRNRGGPDGKSLVGIRFEGQDPTGYSEWLQAEWMRLQAWEPHLQAELLATGDRAPPQAPEDAAFIPLAFVLEVVSSRGSATLFDILELGAFDPLKIRIAVARLIEAGALRTQPTARRSVGLSLRGLLRRIGASLSPSAATGLAVVALVAALALGLYPRHLGFAAREPAAASSRDGTGSEQQAAVDHEGRTHRFYARSAAHLRSGPGTEFEVVGGVAAGEEILVGERKASWYRLVGSDEEPRWIYANLVAEKP